jgi:phosphoenolpyruvate carboxykinase (GTP)
LVFEARDWEEGVFFAAQMSSETTAAAAGAVGRLRFDPMAMLPFCGYHMGDYFAHWLELGRRDGVQLPRIFFVNWFRKGPDGKFLWPGFGENSRVLAWVFGRCAGTAAADETAVGYVPSLGDNGLVTDGLAQSESELATLLAVDAGEWAGQMAQVESHFASFGEKLPPEFAMQLRRLASRLEATRPSAG